MAPSTQTASPKQSNVDRALDAIGNVNPQLLREIKGQLKPRNVGLAIGLSIVAQGLLYLMFEGNLPVSNRPNFPQHHSYCLQDPNTYSCLFDAEGIVRVNWPLWWSHLSATLGAGMIAVLVIGGVYQLIANYAKERQTGTLEFLRLTPQTGERIFVGKILGVPAMVYLAVLAAIPFHAIATLSGGHTLWNLGLFYVSAIEIAVLFFCAAMLLACLGVNQAWLGVVVAGSALYPIAGVLYLLFAIPDEFFGDLTSSTTIFHWWIVPLAQSRFALMSFCWAWTGIAIYWVWQSLGRQFRNPHATLLSKTQTYWITGQITLFWLGFAAKTPSMERIEWDAILYLVSLLYLCVTIALNFVLVPRRQSLQDWARYHHVSAAQNSTEAGTRRSIWGDLLVGEKSPPTLAIALQLGVACLVCLAWVVGMREYWTDDLGWKAIGIVVTTFASLLLLSSLLQHLLHWKFKQRHAVLVASLFFFLGFPPLVLTGLEMPSYSFTTFWTLFVFGGTTFSLENASLAALLGAIGWQLATAALLTNGFKRSIEKLGASEVRQLTNGYPDRS